MGPTILVVDDEPIIADTFTEILRNAGFQVSAFTDPLLATASTVTVQPALVILDMKMPSVSSFELAIKFATLCPQARILIVSEHQDCVATLVQLNNRGYDFECIEKPISADKLLMRVHRLTAHTHPALLVAAPTVSLLTTRPDVSTTEGTVPRDPAS